MEEPAAQRSRCADASIRQGLNEAAWQRSQPVHRSSPRGRPRSAKVAHGQVLRLSISSVECNLAWSILGIVMKVRTSASAGTIRTASFSTLGRTHHQRLGATAARPHRSSAKRTRGGFLGGNTRSRFDKGRQKGAAPQLRHLEVDSADARQQQLETAAAKTIYAQRPTLAGADEDLHRRHRRDR